MANRNAGRRQQRRRRRRMKSSFKIGVLVFMLVICIGGYTGYIIYRNTILSNMYGGIESQNLQEDDSFTITKGAVRYTVFDAGDGEAILIQSGDTEALIDTGSKESAKSLCKKLKDRIGGSLDYLVLTGPGAGRTGGLKKISEKFTIDTCIVGEMGDSAGDIDELIQNVGNRIDGDNMSYDIGEDATLFILKPEVSSSEPGDRSLVTYFTFGKNGFVALSDAGKEEIARAFGSIDSCDVLVLARHGDDVNTSLPGSSYKFCIAAASKIRGLPSDEVEEKIRASFYTTGEVGDLEFISDGQNVKLENEDAIKEALKAAAEEEKEAENEPE